MIEVDKDGHLYKHQRRAIAARMAKVIERFIMEESLHNICVRVDILNVQKDMEQILESYHKTHGNERK